MNFLKIKTERGGLLINLASLAYVELPDETCAVKRVAIYLSGVAQPIELNGPDAERFLDTFTERRVIPAVLNGHP